MDFLDNLRNLKTDITDLSGYSSDALKLLLLHVRNVEQEYNNLQSVVKVDANSLYGSCGNKHFDLCDVDIAEDITTICRHFAILVDVGINTFFTTWANDTNLKIIQEFYPQVTGLRNFIYIKDTVDDLCVYGDTDSRYIDLEMIYKLLLVDGVPMKLPGISKECNRELSNFAIFLNERFLQKIIKDSIDADIAYRNANPGYLKMSHEIVTRKSVLTGKKCYIKTIIWKDGKFLDDPELEYCGISLQRGESTKDLKKILSKLVHKFFIEGKSIEFIQAETIKLKQYFIKSDNKRMLTHIAAPALKIHNKILKRHCF